MEIILNFVVISLLLLTIVFCWRLNKKIVELKNSKKDLGELVAIFDSALVKTHKGIADLKQMSFSSATELQKYVDRAGELLSDLSFMTDTAGKLADRLENAMRIAREEVSSIASNSSSNRKEEIEQLIARIPDGYKMIDIKAKASNNNYDDYNRTKEELLKTIKQIKLG